MLICRTLVKSLGLGLKLCNRFPPIKSMLLFSPKLGVARGRSISHILLLGVTPLTPIKEEKVEASEQNSTLDGESEVDENTVNSEWERVKAIFQEDEFGRWSKEITSVTQATMMACFVGMVFGGMTSSRAAFRDFMERNQATIFDNHLDAKRRLQNHVTLHFLQGGFRWAAKLGIFTGGFMTFLVCLAAYRGKYTVLDYTLSGAVIGSLVKTRLGPPAMLVGGGVGGMLGCFCGTSTKLLFFFAGTSMDDMISFQYELDKKRHDAFREAMSRDEEGAIGDENVQIFKNRPVLPDDSQLIETKPK